MKESRKSTSTIFQKGLGNPINNKIPNFPEKMVGKPKKPIENRFLFLFLGRKMMNYGSAKRASGPVFEPRVNAVHVEAMVAFGQFPAPLAAGDIV
ncbi:hypothetical protein LOK49_LG02G00948 [Camellia lanceoleosa]|uniref:Uncharacterized protein n=1 Tax=Camellia lanceoleosa TaxID=1840588 RepID=A0ACC0IIP8_9ERIC|nr:hypothetical protein LOK49_LG02G00948 [Camellia lanceoleosa]